jgi:hypothetical protein
MNVQRMMGLNLWIALCGSLCAQGTVPTLSVALEEPRFSALDALLGAKVVSSSADAAGQRSGEQGKGKSDVENGKAASADIGVVTDLVVDLATRRITFAAVQVDAGARALPIADLEFDVTRRIWQWKGKQDALLRALEFRAQRLDALHSNIAEASATKKSESGKEAAIAHADSGRYALASECAKRELHASDGRCATAKNLVFELNSASLAFLCASIDDGAVAVPAAALLTPTASDPGAAAVFSVSLAKDALRRVPRLGKDLKQIDERAWRTKLYDAFLVLPPAYEKLAVRKD